MSGMKNTVDGISSRVDIEEEKISELEYIEIEVTKTKQKKIIKPEQSISELWANSKSSNIGVMESLKEQIMQKKIFKGLMFQKFTNLMRTLNSEITKA